MTLRTKVIGRNQTDHGPWVPGTVAGKKFHYQLFGCDWESLHDNNNTPPAVWDGGDIITPNTNDWKKVSGDYQAWLLKQNHPATTGTTGDYPYNGMGRVELAKNIVNGVNTLTQDMFYKGESDARVPNTNTLFVIRYDYVLGEDITVPDNCVLEFDGGSISNDNYNSYSVTFDDTLIVGSEVGTFENVSVLGTIANDFVNILHFGKLTTLSDCTTVFQQIVNLLQGNKRKRLYLPAGRYTISDYIKPCNNIEIFGDGRNSEVYNNSTDGGHKCIFVNEGFPALTTGCVRSNSIPKISISSFSQDRRTINLASTPDTLVGNLCAVLAGRHTASSTGYFFVYCAKVLAISGNSLTLDYPIPDIDETDFVCVPDASHEYSSGDAYFFTENVYIHDLYLNQLTNVSSGYYAITAGYNNRFENLIIHASTPCGSNLSAHCVFKNINADCEAGCWDDAELTCDNLYENIIVTRYDSRLNVLGFHISGGSCNTAKNITLVGSGDIGSETVGYNTFENIHICKYDYHEIGSTAGMIACAKNVKAKDIFFTDCTVVTGTGGTNLNILSSGGVCLVENVYGNISVGEGVTAKNRILVSSKYLSNIHLNADFHIGSLEVSNRVVMRKGIKCFESAPLVDNAQTYLSTSLFGDMNCYHLLGNKFVVHAKFDIVKTGDVPSPTGSPLIAVVAGTFNAWMNIPTFDFSTGSLQAELFININNGKANATLILKGKNYSEVVNTVLTDANPSGENFNVSARERTTTSSEFPYKPTYVETEIII